MNNRRAGS